MTAIIGKSALRPDALEKVTGTAKYIDDMELPNMLFARVLRSEEPHARILSIDYSLAQSLSGVCAIITSKDVPVNAFGVQIKDQPVLAEMKVRQIGEAVVAVAAESEEIALKAIDKIKVKYDPLPAVFNATEALKSDAPRVHEKGNIATTRNVVKGDVERGFQESDEIVSDKFTTQKVEHCHIEQHGCLAQPEPNGHLTIWAGNAQPFAVQAELARILKMPLASVRWLQPVVGGNFGSRNELSVEPIAALLAIKTGRPVKLVRTREEEFTASTTRHSHDIEIKTGVKSDGRIIARQAKIIADTGAYFSFGEIQLVKATILSSGPYDIPNIKSEGILVYTNNVVGGAMRGFGAPQIYAAEETHMDNIAKKLGIDPLEIRLRNALKEGDRTSTGQVLHSVAIRETLTTAAESFGWKKGYSSSSAIPSATWKKRGRGIACIMYPVGAPERANPSSAIVKIFADGSVSALVGAVELGQGLTTALAQIVAEELSVPYENVSLVCGGTDVAPYDFGSVGSRVTYTTGNALKNAAESAKRMLVEAAAEKLGVTIDSLKMTKDGRICTVGDEAISMTMVDAVRLCGEKGRPVIGLGSFKPDNARLDPVTGQGRPAPTYVYATQIAEVEVDTETGLVEVLRIVASHDVGRAVNPTLIKGQIFGALGFGIGMALTEKMITHNGKVMNSNYTDYILPTAVEMPEAEAILVEEYEPTGPFGVKSIAEPPNVPTAPAIINAIQDAVGCTLRELPATPEKVLKAISG